VKKLPLYTVIGVAGYQYLKSKENREKATDALNKFYAGVESWISKLQQSNTIGPQLKSAICRPIRTPSAINLPTQRAFRK